MPKILLFSSTFSSKMATQKFTNFDKVFFLLHTAMTAVIIQSSGSDGKELACNAGDPGSTPAFGSSPGEGNSHPLQYSCMEKSMDREAWWAIVHGVTKSQA